MSEYICTTTFTSPVTGRTFHRGDITDMISARIGQHDNDHTHFTPRHTDKADAIEADPTHEDKPKTKDTKTEAKAEAKAKH